MFIAVLKLVDNNEPFATIVPYTPENSLALIYDCELSKDSYLEICLGAIDAGCKVYYPNKAVREAKE